MFLPVFLSVQQPWPVLWSVPVFCGSIHALCLGDWKEGKERKRERERERERGREGGRNVRGGEGGREKGREGGKERGYVKGREHGKVLNRPPRQKRESTRGNMHFVIQLPPIVTSSEVSAPD